MARQKRKIGPGRPTSLPGIIGQVAITVGGVEELAARLGVSSRTVHRWAHGKSKMPYAAEALLATIGRHSNAGKGERGNPNA